MKPMAYYDILHPNCNEGIRLKYELMEELKEEAYQTAVRDLKMDYVLRGYGTREEELLKLKLDDLQLKYARSEFMRQRAESQITELATQPEPEPETLEVVTTGHAATYQFEEGPGLSDNNPDHSQAIRDTLSDYRVSVTIQERTPGPSATRYLLKPAKGTAVNDIGARQDELRLAIGDLRVVGAIPGTGCVAIEVTNTERSIVTMGDVTCERTSLNMAVGISSTGDTFSFNLADMPHLIVAGTTGSGKSGFINAVLSNLLYLSPDKCKLALIDLKRVELAPYRNAPHLLRETAKTADQAVKMLADIADMMDERYMAMEESGCRSFDRFQELTDTPHIVVVADELAEIMASSRKRVEALLQRLAQLGRAAGIHVIVATQRPSVDVITGVIKANFPARVAFKTASRSDSLVILDRIGAESLAGRGDGLMMHGSSVERFQTAWLDDETVENVVSSTHS